MEIINWIVNFPSNHAILTVIVAFLGFPWSWIIYILAVIALDMIK